MSPSQHIDWLRPDQPRQLLTAGVLLLTAAMGGCTDGPPTSPLEQVSARLTELPRAGGFGPQSMSTAGFAGITFADDETGTTISLDSTRGIMVVTNPSTGQHIAVELPVAELNGAVRAFEAIADGDANLIALADLRPYENMPNGMEPMRAAPVAEGPEPMLFAQGSDDQRSRSGLMQPVLVRRLGTSQTGVGLQRPNIGAFSASFGWDPRCQDAAANIGQLKSSYLHDRRRYIQGLLDLIPWRDLVNVSLTDNGTVNAVNRPDLVNALFSALRSAGDWRSSFAYDYARVMYNSWNCEYTIKVKAPVSRIVTQTITRSENSSGGGSGSSGAGNASMICTTTMETWSVSTDGGATWTDHFVPTTICETHAT